MSDLERRAAAEPTKEIGISVDVYASLYSPTDQRLLLKIDEMKALSGIYVLTPLRERLQTTPDDYKFWQRYSYRKARVNEYQTGYFPQDKVPGFIQHLGRNMSVQDTAKSIINSDLIPGLKPHEKLSLSDFNTLGGIFRRNIVTRGVTGLNCGEVFHFLPSAKAINAIETAQEAGSGIVLVDPQDIKDGQPLKIRYKDQMVSADGIAGSLVLGHLAEATDPKDDIDRAKRMKRLLNRVLDNLSVSLDNGEELIKHKLRIIESEEEYEVYFDRGKRRYKRLDEVSSQFKNTPGSIAVFEHYFIGRKDQEFISDGTMTLVSGKVNVLQIPSDSELSYCLATLGEKFDHQGTALIRRSGRDHNLHDLSASTLVHYCNCDPVEVSDSQSVFSDFFTSTIASRLKETPGRSFKVVFAREIDHAQRVDLLRQYLRSTGMFDEEEITSWNPEGSVSGSMATRLKVAAAFLSSGVIILDDIFDRRFYTTTEWAKEEAILKKVSRFIAGEAKREERIILLGINSIHELQRDYFTKEKVMGKIYTVGKQKFVDLSK